MKKPSKTTLRNRADKLFSQRVRGRGICEATGYRFRCSMTLQCAHIVPRKYLAVRWTDENALSLCGAHHYYFTHNPIQWEDWRDQAFPGRYAEMRRMALADHPKPDYAAILERLAV